MHSIQRHGTGVGAVAFFFVSLVGHAALAAPKSVILIHAAFGSPTAFQIQGRILEQQEVSPSERNASAWENLKDSFNVVETDEIRGARLEVEVGGERYTATSDDDGVWRVHAARLSRALAPGNVSVVVRAPDVTLGAEPARGSMLILPETSTVAVISDVDDTILHTGVLDKVGAVWRTATQNPSQREPILGVAEAYLRAKSAGVAGFFYVSGSPQNLHERIVEFMRIHAIPTGPLFLKNFGEDSITDTFGYKVNRISTIFERYPRHRFILIGDSGEKDPEIYRAIAKKYPRQIAGIVIRFVPGSPREPSRYRNMALVWDFTDPTVISSLVKAPKAPPVRLINHSVSGRDTRLYLDAKRLRSFTKTARWLEREIEEGSELFSREPTSPLGPDERRQLFAQFEGIVGLTVALDDIAKFHRDFWQVPLTRDPKRHAQHFLLAFGATCTKTRLALAFIDRTQNKPQFEKLLDEGNPESGVSAGLYALLKWNVVHLRAAVENMALQRHHQQLIRSVYPKITDDDFAAIVSDANADYAEIRDRVLDNGLLMLVKNGLDILKDTTVRAWLPVQAGVAEWMGDAKVHRLDTMLISESQAREAAERSQPGDILVERRNWYLSNIGLPGFWPHAALFVGTPDTLSAFLDEDADVKQAYGRAFSEVLKEKFPKAWTAYTTKEDGHPRRIVEAMSEGVVFTSAEHSVRADYAAALRPRLSRLEIARAIERAFSYVGRPYDFDFDFFTDASLVCSELVVKAYEPRDGVTGLHFSLDRILGRMTLGPNSMVQQFGRALKNGQNELDFVWFLDGKERERRAVWADEQTFVRSAERLKWDIAQR